MGKKGVRIFFWAMILAMCGIYLFSKVPTRQGVDYKVRVYNIPRYIKAIEFLDRDFHYKRIVREEIDGKLSGEDRVLAIFNWCVRNIRHQPAELPVVDDHPLNIIIRGYGGQDQIEDVFTILCTYAGFESFYRMFCNENGSIYFISFVKIKGRWRPFSLYNNVYITLDRTIASVDEIRRRPELLSQFTNRIHGFEPGTFLKELEKTEFKALSMRVVGQNPAGRVLYHLKKNFFSGK